MKISLVRIIFWEGIKNDTHVVCGIAISPPHAHVAHALEVSVEEVDELILGDRAREPCYEEATTLDVFNPLLSVFRQGIPRMIESAC